MSDKPNQIDWKREAGNLLQAKLQAAEEAGAKGTKMMVAAVADLFTVQEERDQWKSRAEAAEAEVARMKGITPELPPLPPTGAGTPRYGVRWNGPTEPLAVPMDDGYWTPWHLADRLQDEVARLERILRDTRSVVAALVMIQGGEVRITDHVLWMTDYELEEHRNQLGIVTIRSRVKQ